MHPTKGKAVFIGEGCPASNIKTFLGCSLNVFTNGDFESWRLYSEDGKYFKVQTSVLNAGTIELNFDNLEELDLTETWSYSPYLKDLDIQYARIYCNGLLLKEVCPPDLKIDFDIITNKLKAFENSFRQAKLDTNKNCIYKLIPERILIEFCDIKDKIAQHVFKTYKKPVQYDFQRDLMQVLTDIKFRPLNIDTDSAKKEIRDEQTLQKFRDLAKKNSYINYDMFRTNTGRLATERNSFPIQSLNKKYRSIIKPHNDYLLEIDINGAEIRTFLNLAGIEVVKEDIYEWAAKNVFDNELTRDEVKLTMITWLYESREEIKQEHVDKLNKLFNKSKVKNKYWDGTKITTFFGREIESDDHHSISYMNQSTFIDLFHRSVIKVHNLLENRKTKISFLLHDSCVIDFASEDKDIYQEIIKIFSETELGYMKPNIKVGYDYGAMKNV